MLPTSVTLIRSGRADLASKCTLNHLTVTESMDSVGSLTLSTVSDRTSIINAASAPITASPQHARRSKRL
uniref:Uncharacterized protein n=1 Tax=Arundo donax TaxID=35708 RepID=A0A0A9G0K3_ARUDO